MALLSTYVYDPTGINPLNRVTNERHNVQPPASITDASIFFLNAAPAFAESIIVRDGPSANAGILVEGRDYILSTQFLWKSWELTKMIYCSITMINRNYAGDVYVEYQTLGGDFIVNDTEALEAIARDIYKTRYIYWEQVVLNIPGLPPFDHSMSGTDTVGWGEVVDAILRLAAAILDAGNGGGGGGSGGGGSDAALQQHIQSTSAHRLSSVGGSNLFNYALANESDFDNVAANRYTNPAVIVVWLRKYITSLGLGTAPQDITQLQQRVNQIDQLIQTIQTKQTDVDAVLDAINVKIEDIESRQDSVEDKVSDLAVEIPAIKEDITELQQVINGDPNTGLEARLTAVTATAAGHTVQLGEVADQLTDMQTQIDNIPTTGPFDPTDILDRLTTLEEQMIAVTDDVTALQTTAEITRLGYDPTVPKMVLTQSRNIVLAPAQYVNIKMIAGGLISTDPLVPQAVTNTSYVTAKIKLASGTIIPLHQIVVGVNVDGSVYNSSKGGSDTSMSDVVETPPVEATDFNGAVGLTLSDGNVYGSGATVEDPGVGGSSSPSVVLRYTNDSLVDVTLILDIQQYAPFVDLVSVPGLGAIELDIITP